ncbi:hypothetical protein JQX13_36900 [Archangium violaceum]|uniref:hypothetical protein n=1 Tax=Archangium violaceum TaxID=83451 RepID=UPI00193B4AD7|nr:hypothetical protein [Archangium violaceum]QRK05687.1 hypothetical protein JQX13_36900 [Archangium violaceum]
MKNLIRQLAHDQLWNQWVAANSAGTPVVDAGCVSGPAVSAKAGCISKTGCVSKAGCISKTGCIS